MLLYQQSYQPLPFPMTIPKTMWSCMWRALPILTSSYARRACRIGVFGLVQGYPSAHYQTLPTANKYCYNDTTDHTLPADSRRLGLCLAPQEQHEPLAVVMRDPYVISINRTPQHIDAFFRSTMKWLVIANIVLGLFTLFNLYIYPQYIYEPILYSPPVNTLHPHQI